MKTLITALSALAVSTLVASAHQPRSGLWTYPETCCQNHNDCHWIPQRSVQMTQSGYLVTLHPPDHPHVTATMSFLVPYGREDKSGDDDYHACIGRYTGAETDIGGIFYCLYVLPGSV